MDEIISHIRSNFRARSFVNALFRLSKIGRLLSQPEAPNAFLFMDAYWISSESTRSFFKRLVQDKALEKRFDVFICSFQFLKNKDLWTLDNFHVVAAHTDPYSLASALCHLQDAGMLTVENRALVVAHRAPDSLAKVLCGLQSAGILTELNLRMVVEHKFFLTLAYVLFNLRHAGILTEANFSALLHPSHVNLLGASSCDYVWFMMPLRLLTQENFDRLIHASEDANPSPAIQGVFYQIIGRNAPSRTINNTQSTHTASIHRSVSESALRLKASYGEHLILQKTIRRFQADIEALSNDTLPHQAAKRAMARLIEEEGLFKDPSSGVSTHELLALAYLAIGDDKKRSGSVEDAKAQLIQGLYEIQRGYNLNEAGVDLGDEDSPICSAGIFNKLMEKLNGIHSDVTLVFVTPRLASLKFPLIVKAAAIAYLKKQDVALLNTIKAENGAIFSIWESIKLDVEDVLWDEFKEAFSNNRADNRFEALMDTGVDVALSPAELLKIKRTFPASVTSISLLKNDEVSSDTPHATLMMN